MNVHISYRLHKTPAVEKDIQHQVEKLRKRLQVFRPELIHLKGMVEEVSPREGCSVSLNLRLPSGQMAVQVKASTATAAVKRAFEDLLQQVNKHKELLRSSHKWTRRQKEASARRNVSVPFEQTLAAVFPAMVSAEDVRSYVNVNLSRLERFVEREIYFREASDFITPDSITRDEVIDETIAAALGEGAMAIASRSRSAWLSNPGSTASQCGLSMNSRARTIPTVAPCTWKILPASKTSRPATSPDCNFISPTKPSPKKPSSPTAAWPRPSRS
jgi:ribosome-associated translation inhibitor RaiA